jgi:hypothetical protein
LARQHGDKVIVIRVNIDQNKDFASIKGVRMAYTKDYYLKLKDKAKKDKKSKIALQQLEINMGLPDLRLLHGGKEIARLWGSQTLGVLENAVLIKEDLLPRPKKPATLSRKSQGASPAGDSSPPAGKDGLPAGMSREKK